MIELNNIKIFICTPCDPKDYNLLNKIATTIAKIVARGYTPLMPDAIINSIGANQIGSLTSPASKIAKQDAIKSLIGACDVFLYCQELGETKEMKEELKYAKTVKHKLVFNNQIPLGFEMDYRIQKKLFVSRLGQFLPMVLEDMNDGVESADISKNGDELVIYHRLGKLAEINIAKDSNLQILKDAIKALTGFEN